MSVTSARVLVNSNRRNNKGVRFTPAAALLHPTEAAVRWDWLLPELH